MDGGFEERLAGRSAWLKSLLLDQSFIAGVGNIYADEALWLARLHPLRAADTLNRDEVARLHRSIRKVLSVVSTTFRFAIGRQKLGQPVPESNLVLES